MESKERVLYAQYLVASDGGIDLGAYEPYYRGEIKKKRGNRRLRELRKELADLQELLYAEGKQKLLVVLQGIDSSGKDGTIRRVFGAVNPQGVKVTSFKTPTKIELAHDYLWRVHPHTPGSGKISIFNRSHYEDVLIVRVRDLAPQTVWERRYDHINEFERLLTDEGVTILKFFLHISKKRQAERFLARLDRPHKRWKFNPADLEERRLWDAYQEAYEVMLNRTSTPWAPWHIIPADRKWYRNLVVAEIIVDRLKALGMKFPQEVADLESYRAKLRDIIDQG